MSDSRSASFISTKTKSSSQQAKTKKKKKIEPYISPFVLQAKQRAEERIRIVKKAQQNYSSNSKQNKSIDQIPKKDWDFTPPAAPLFDPNLKKTEIFKIEPKSKRNENDISRSNISNIEIDDSELQETYMNNKLTGTSSRYSGGLTKKLTSSENVPNQEIEKYNTNHYLKNDLQNSFDTINTRVSSTTSYHSHPSTSNISKIQITPAHQNKYSDISDIPPPPDTIPISSSTLPPPVPDYSNKTIPTHLSSTDQYATTSAVNSCSCCKGECCKFCNNPSYLRECEEKTKRAREYYSKLLTNRLSEIIKQRKELVDNSLQSRLQTSTINTNSNTLYQNTNVTATQMMQGMSSFMISLSEILSQMNEINRRNVNKIKIHKEKEKIKKENIKYIQQIENEKAEFLARQDPYQIYKSTMIDHDLGEYDENNFVNLSIDNKNQNKNKSKTKESDSILFDDFKPTPPQPHLYNHNSKSSLLDAIMSKLQSIDNTEKDIMNYLENPDEYEKSKKLNNKNERILINNNESEISYKSQFITDLPKVVKLKVPSYPKLELNKDKEDEFLEFHKDLTQ